LQLVNLLVRDGVGALAISAIAHLIEIAISRVEGETLDLGSGAGPAVRL
jgi:hypothetical protein